MNRRAIYFCLCLLGSLLGFVADSKAVPLGIHANRNLSNVHVGDKVTFTFSLGVGCSVCSEDGYPELSFSIRDPLLQGHNTGNCSTSAAIASVAQLQCSIGDSRSFVNLSHNQILANWDGTLISTEISLDVPGDWTITPDPGASIKLYEVGANQSKYAICNATSTSDCPTLTGFYVNQTALPEPNPTSEPSAIALLGAGLAGVLATNRRRKTGRR